MLHTGCVFCFLIYCVIKAIEGVGFAPGSLQRLAGKSQQRKRSYGKGHCVLCHNAIMLQSSVCLQSFYNLVIPQKRCVKYLSAETL